MTFIRPFTATPADIDELGHVNNAVWVRWIQELAVAHWAAVASVEQQAAYVWVVTRHEIDYRGNVSVGQTVTGETWVPAPPKGARFDRHVRFIGNDEGVKVEAVTTWALCSTARPGACCACAPRSPRRFCASRRNNPACRGLEQQPRLKGLQQCSNIFPNGLVPVCAACARGRSI